MDPSVKIGLVDVFGPGLQVGVGAPAGAFLLLAELGLDRLEQAWQAGLGIAVRDSQQDRAIRFTVPASGLFQALVALHDHDHLAAVGQFELMGAVCHIEELYQNLRSTARSRKLKADAAGDPLEHSFNRPAEAGNWIGEVAGDRSQNSGHQKDSQFNFPLALHIFRPLDSSHF